MVMHELFGVAGLVVVGAVVVAALSKNSNTAGVFTATLDGFSGLVNSITAPARAGAGGAG
jgi:hypothetical protein